VPYGKFPEVSPSFNVVAPIPEPTNIDLLTIIALTLFCLFTFALGLDFVKVVTRVAPVSSLLKFLI
jgi:hypothetical protein